MGGADHAVNSTAGATRFREDLDRHTVSTESPVRLSAAGTPPTVGRTRPTGVARLTDTRNVLAS